MSLLNASQLRAQFVDVATAKFATNVEDFVTLRQMVEARGGRFLNDHGAIRTADADTCRLLVRAAAVIGLRKELDYRFPAKKLVSFDLQAIGEDAHQFKIFVSQVDLNAMPDDVAELIRQDCLQQAAAVNHAPFEALITRFEQEGGLSTPDAEAFIDHFAHRLMSRNGAPISRKTLEAVAAQSGEAASALALGPDFNHVTIDVRAGGYVDIEQMTAQMQAHGFRMLPRIQGERGTSLRQTATMAATVEIPVLEADGSVGSAPAEKQFVEIIERNQATSDWGAPLWQQDGAPLIFRNFLAANAINIFDAASTRARPAPESC